MRRGVRVHSLCEGKPSHNSTLTETGSEASWEKHGQIVYKSLSGVRSMVTRLTPAHRERFHDLSSCPTQFQQWIPGSDFRVHVAGNDVFACKVTSSATDYRYPGPEEETPEIQPRELPDDLADRCRRLVASMSLALAGIDLRRTPDGQWFLLRGESLARIHLL